MKVKVTHSCPTLCNHSPWSSPGQNTGVGSLSLLQGIFPAQGSDPRLLYCRWVLYQLSHKGNPIVSQYGFNLISCSISQGMVLICHLSRYILSRMNSPSISALPTSAFILLPGMKSEVRSAFWGTQAKILAFLSLMKEPTPSGFPKRKRHLGKGLI